MTEATTATPFAMQMTRRFSTSLSALRLTAAALIVSNAPSFALHRRRRWWRGWGPGGGGGPQRLRRLNKFIPLNWRDSTTRKTCPSARIYVAAAPTFPPLSLSREPLWRVAAPPSPLVLSTKIDKKKRGECAVAFSGIACLAKPSPALLYSNLRTRLEIVSFHAYEDSNGRLFHWFLLPLCTHTINILDFV
jgi:hypothetical protein